MSAWITREWIDAEGKRRRGQSTPGTTGVRAADQFVVEWIDPAGKRRRQKIPGVGKPAKQLADRKCEQLNSQLVLGTYEAKDLKTFAEAKAKFLATALAGKRDTTAYSVRATLDRFEAIIRPARLAAITAETIDTFAAARLAQPAHPTGEGTGGEEKEAGPTIRESTVNRDLRNLKTFFRRLVRWGMMVRAPEIVMLPEQPLEKATYTPAEFVALFNAVDAARRPANLSPEQRSLWWRALLAVFWETGCRRCEPIALTWQHVDFDRRQLTVAGTGKTRKIQRLNFGELSLSLLQSLAAAVGGTHPFEWLHDGSGLNVELKRIQKAAGLDPARQNFAFHAIRRTVGETVAEIHGLTAAQYKLGHSTPTITAKHYAPAAMQKLAAASAMPVPEGLQPALRVVG